MTAVAHGGQILVSQAVAEELRGVELLDLGPHRLRDIDDEHPPLPGAGRRPGGRLPPGAFHGVVRDDPARATDEPDRTATSSSRASGVSPVSIGW